MYDIIQNMKHDQFVAVDLFCGAGGLTYGLKKSGIKVVAGFDIDDTCKYAYEKNNKGAKFIKKDIVNITKKDINPFFKNTKYKVLVGCAPCQTFSTHSTKIKKNKNLSKDKRWTLLNHFSRLINEVNPDFVSMENVPLLQKQSIFKSFVKNLEKNNYVVEHQIVNCSKIGIPQNRRRLVLIAAKKEITKEINLQVKESSVVTVKNAISELPKIKAGEQNKKDSLHFSAPLSEKNLKRIKYSKPGGTWKDWPKSLRAECHKKESGSTYTSVYARMVWNKPSPTITTQFIRYGTGRFGHPIQNRALSLREGALLQSFPKNYKFFKNGDDFSSVQIGMHIGNAVPPKLGLFIGNSIKTLV